MYYFISNKPMTSVHVSTSFQLLCSLFVFLLLAFAAGVLVFNSLLPSSFVIEDNSNFVFAVLC